LKLLHVDSMWSLVEYPIRHGVHMEYVGGGKVQASLSV